MLSIEATRGGKTENRHIGYCVVTDASGTLLHCTPGSRECATFFRSAAKPFQALPLLQAGLDKRLSLEELAICCASHTGSAYHLAHVRAILQKADLPESALGCGAHWPLDILERDRLICAGLSPTAIHNNCSGKHAGMLLCCREAGWPTEGYLSPEHPLQKAIYTGLLRYAELSSEQVSLAIDGCGAPIYYLPLIAMARLFACLGNEPVFGRLAEAMTTYPDAVGGPGRVDSELMKATRGRLLAKVGADGVLCVSRMRTGQGLALKIADGNGEVRNAALLEILRRLKWLDQAEYEAVSRRAGADLVRHNTLGQLVGMLELHGWDT